MLALSGELNLRMFGPSARPPLPDKISKYAWKADARPEDQNRRSAGWQPEESTVSSGSLS